MQSAMVRLKMRQIWLRIQEMMADLLSDQAVRSRGIFRPEAVAELRDLMHRREFLLVKQVFSLMVLELWFRMFYDGVEVA